MTEEHHYYEYLMHLTAHKAAIIDTRMQEQAMETQLQWMLSRLTSDELETAARSSFEYLQTRTRTDPAANDNDEDDINLDPEPYAKKMAERYWKSKKETPS